MALKQQFELTAFALIQEFLDRDPSLGGGEAGERLATVNATAARTAFDGAVARITAARVDQDILRRTSAGAQAQFVETRRSMVIHQMRVLSRTALSRAANLPALAGMRTPKRTVGTQALLTAAEGMLTVASRHAEALTRVMGPDVLEKFRAQIDELRAAKSEGENARAQRTNATAVLKEEFGKARDALKVLDALVLRAVADDAGLMREWAARRRVSGARRRVVQEVASGESEGGSELKVAA
jgi:hypothetical protein